MRITMGVRLATEFCYDCVHRNPRAGDKHTRYWCDAHNIMLDDLEGDDLVDDKPLQRNSIKLDECKLYNFEALVDGVQYMDRDLRFTKGLCLILAALVVVETYYIAFGAFGALATLLGVLMMIFTMTLCVAWKEEL